MTQATPHQLSEVQITTERVSLLVDGKPMEAVRVKMDANYVWRIRFSDRRLSEQVFANAERAVRWLAAGMPLAAGDELDIPRLDPAHHAVRPAPSPLTSPRPQRRPRGTVMPKGETPDPKWQTLDWTPRRPAAPVPTDADWLPLDWLPKPD